MDENRIQILEKILLKKLDGTITSQEQQLLDEWMAQNPENRDLVDSLSNPDWLAAQMAEFEGITVPLPEQQPVRRIRRLYKWGWAAAAVLLLLAGVAYLWQHKEPAAVPVARVTTPVDVMPGRQGAVLTLGDGSEIVLDSLQNGEVARQGTSSIVLHNGELKYDKTATASGAVSYNTVTTPRGRQFSLVLPDGTRVWLNAATTIRYPVAFIGDRRTVTMTGEAYFEVAQNVQQPFAVQVGESVFNVLGTSFNIKAYTDEQVISTTLLTGKLGVQAGKAKSIVLAPGQQANIIGSDVQVNTHAAIEAVMAWKNGVFNFNDKKLEDVMRELSRWYDLEIVYEKGIPDITFGGEMGRNEPLSDVLLGLQDVNVKFRIEANRRLVVLP